MFGDQSGHSRRPLIAGNDKHAHLRINPFVLNQQPMMVGRSHHLFVEGVICFVGLRQITFFAGADKALERRLQWFWGEGLFLDGIGNEFRGQSLKHTA